TADPAAATFAVVNDALSMPPLSAFAQGTAEYRDRSTTIILQASRLQDTGLVFTGPGIDGRIQFSFDPAPHGFADQWLENRALYPR
ncbi:phosphonate C-P lyase system protein PhnH, partial [Streptomyces brasiliscabiei]|uniref:phosphonate C-P lyase system protein PhnH n=1 Tax=Streptomyces brasiliscabiei TaxID=2736302 RepID=UPI0038F76FB3